MLVVFSNYTNLVCEVIVDKGTKEKYTSTLADEANFIREACRTKILDAKKNIILKN